MEPDFFKKTERKNKLKMDFSDQSKFQILHGINQLKTERKKKDQKNLIPQIDYRHQTQSKNKIWGKVGNSSNQLFQQTAQSHKISQFQINKMNSCDSQSIQKSNQYNPLFSSKHDSQSQSLSQIQHQYNQQSKKQSNCIDQVSLFTFGKKSTQNKKPLKTSEPQFSQILYTDNQLKTQKMSKQKTAAFNPLLNLSYKDYETRFLSPHELQLHKLKEKDSFIADFYHDSYEPVSMKLKNEIRDEVMELMQINKGKYLINVLLARILEQWIKVDQLEDQIEQEIKEFQSKNQLILTQNHPNDSAQHKIIICELIETTFEEKEQIQGSQKNKQSKLNIQSKEKQQIQKNLSDILSSCSSEIERNELLQLRSHQQNQDELQDSLVNPQQVYLYEEQCLTDQDCLSTPKIIQLNLQLESLCQQAQKYHQRIETQSNKCNQQQQSLQSQTTSMIELQNTYNNLEQQFKTLKSKASHFVKTTMQKITHQSNRIQLIYHQIDHIQNYKKQKLKQFFQHLFDVFYVELQILSSKELKSIAINKNFKYQPKSRKKDTQPEDLQRLYQLFIKSTSISDILKHSLQNTLISVSNNQIKKCLNTVDVDQNIIKQTSQMLEQNKGAVIQCYKMIEKYMKLFFCVKIKNHFISKKNIDKDGKNFISDLFHLLDTNSYHSYVTKEKFFSFSDQFIPYAFKVHEFLIEDLEINLTETSRDQKPQQSEGLKRQKKQKELLSSVERMLTNQYENRIKKQQIQRIDNIFSKIIPKFDNEDELKTEKKQQSRISSINFVSKGKLKSKKLTSLIESLLFINEQE